MPLERSCSRANSLLMNIALRSEILIRRVEKRRACLYLPYLRGCAREIDGCFLGARRNSCQIQPSSSSRVRFRYVARRWNRRRAEGVIESVLQQCRMPIGSARPNLLCLERELRRSLSLAFLLPVITKQKD
jgi:hypothetical protein